MCRVQLSAVLGPGQGHRLRLKNRVIFNLIEFWYILAGIITILRRYAECNSWSCWVKVKVTDWGQRSIMTIVFFITLQCFVRFYNNLVSHNALIKIGFIDLRSRSLLEVKGHRVKNTVCSVTFESIMEFWNNFTKVFASHQECRVQLSAVSGQGQGLAFTWAV